LDQAEGGKGTYLELLDLYLPVVTVWLMTLVVTPPPAESSSLVVLVPLILLDVLATRQRMEQRARKGRWGRRTKIGGCECWKGVDWTRKGLRQSNHASEECEACKEHVDEC